MQSGAAEVLPFPGLAEHLPVPPPAKLDPVLDATVACVARHGLTKTSLSDIAREMGVAPSTVYRKVGSVPNAAMLVVAREGQRMLARIPDVIAGVEGPRVITVFLAAGIAHAAEHPMVAKILTDEEVWVGRLATRRLDQLLTTAAEAITPLLDAAVAAGTIRDQDTTLLAHWIVRIAITCISAPPPGALIDAIDALLLPVLDPFRGGR